MNRIKGKSFLLLMVGILLPAFVGCGSGYTGLKTKSEPVVKTIVVLPFETETMLQTGEQYVSCSVCGSTYKGGLVDLKAETVLTNMLFEKLKDRPNIILLTPGQSKGLWADAVAGLVELPYVQILQKIGAKSGTDAILYGRIFRYEERVGKTYSAQNPASVAFDLHLVRTSDGVIIWKGRFDETQVSLMENILKLPTYLKRGFKWLTADELAREGMEEMMESFAY